ncbi:MAG: efflux RND transporter periplasmic adaptor subunit [Planctomycetota bacterium]
MKRIVTWGLVIAVAGAIGAALLWPRPTEVDVVACKRGTAVAFVIEEAKTRLDEDYLVAMPVDGRLLRVDLREGDVVQKGQVIARVDRFEREQKQKQLEARRAEIKALIVGVDEAKPKPEEIAAAELARDEARARHAAAAKAREACHIDFTQEEKIYKRKHQLFLEEAINETEHIEARRRYLVLKAKCEEATEIEQAMKKRFERTEKELERLRESRDDNEYQRTAYQAQLEQIRADEALIQDELAKCEIRAPVTGPVLDVLQEDKQVLRAGTPLLKLGDLASLRIESDILSEEVGRMAVGQPVEIFGPAVGGDPVTGQIERIYPSGFEKISSLGIEQQRVKVIIAFDNRALRLRPGVRVDVRIITDRKEGALLVPERALFKQAGRWHVFAARGEVAELTPVEVGIQNDEQAEIVSGLGDGDLVIPDPPPELADGARIEPKRSDD